MIGVDTTEGMKQVRITYPAGDPKELYAESPIDEWDLEDFDEGEDDLPADMLFDRRSMESDLSDVVGDIDGVVRIWETGGVQGTGGYL